MKKISQKTVKFNDFNEANVNLIATVNHCNTTFMRPHIIIDGYTIFGTQTGKDDTFSFLIPKNKFDGSYFQIQFNVNRSEEDLQILINTCRIKFEFPQLPGNNSSFKPFAGLTPAVLLEFKDYGYIAQKQLKKIQL